MLWGALELFTVFLFFPRLFRIRPLPLVRQLLDRARFGHGLQGIQCIQDNAALAVDIARLSEHAAASKLNQQGPGRLDGRHPLRIAHGDGGDSRFFGHSLNQTHGLMALRSDRHQ